MFKGYTEVIFLVLDRTNLSMAEQERRFADQQPAK